MSDENVKFFHEESRRLTAENQTLRAELQALCTSVHALTEMYDVLQHITPQTDIRDLLEKILDICLQMLKAGDGSLLLTDEAKNELVFTVVRGTVTGKLEGYRMPMDKGIAGWVVKNRRPQIVLDVRGDPRFYTQVDEMFGFKTRSLVCVPVYLDDGRVLGVIEIVNRLADSEFKTDDLNLLLIASNLAATAMRRAERYVEQAEQRDLRRAELLSLHSPRR